MPIEIAPGGIAMQHDHWLTASHINKMHRETVHRMILWRKRKCSLKRLVFNRKHRESPLMSGVGNVLPQPKQGRADHLLSLLSFMCHRLSRETALHSCLTRRSYFRTSYLLAPLLPISLFQGMFQVSENIFDVFDAYREAQKRLADTVCLTNVSRNRAMRHRGGMTHERSDST